MTIPRVKETFDVFTLSVLQIIADSPKWASQKKLAFYIIVDQ